MAPKRRRDEAEKAEEEKDHTTSTKCGLAGLLSEKIEADGVAVTREESLAAVDFLVAALTRLRFEALCLLGLVAVRMCEDARREGQGLQPHCATCRRLRKTELVEDDMYAAICAVSVCDLTEQGRKRGRPSKRDQHPEDDLFRHVCEEHFPRDEEAAGARVNRSGLTPFLPPLSKGVFTNVKNHYAANFAAWLARSFRCRIDDELREVGQAEVGQAELRTPATKKLDKLAWSMAHAVLYDGELEQPRWWVGWAQGAAAQAAGAAAAAAAQGAGPAGGAAAAQAAGAAAAAAAQGAGPAGGAAAAQAAGAAAAAAAHGAGPAGGAAAAQAWTALVDYVNAQRASKRAAELLLREVKGTQATYKKASTRHMEWAAEILAGLEARRDQLGAQVQQLTQAQPLTREGGVLPGRVSTQHRDGAVIFRFSTYSTYGCVGAALTAVCHGGGGAGSPLHTGNVVGWRGVCGCPTCASRLRGHRPAE
ncbi:hypothetical protein CHLRE_03g173132v5 [Chlamydomonas reinhardtii]|uniref:Uncharacterized protein n=1 Tax=Chlamydomonas reinhardtii TaxID=3055 RepID=A0A2K3DX73_CHLRE|nr:uncharacterized protein CHLRE_03g173132v5 [Chlamydomonas reinhardtii]PNW85132.1 hypothetical protein CHLRE_03g173132v5 [Chlamydomonas reinhardtii]